MPECQRFSRFHADLPDRDLAFGLEDILHQVVVAERYAARRYDQIDVPCLGESTGEIRQPCRARCRSVVRRRPRTGQAHRSRMSCCRGSFRASDSSPGATTSFPVERTATIGRRWTRTRRLTDRSDQSEVCWPQYLPTTGHGRTTGDVLTRLANIVEWTRRSIDEN